jgi:hypothetical protein
MKTKITHDYTAASSISKTNIESQSGYNTASHLGLQSYQSPHDVSKSSLSQGAASEPLQEPKPKVNIVQRLLSSLGKPRPSHGSQTSPTRKPFPTYIRSSLKIPTGDKTSPVLSNSISEITPLRDTKSCFSVNFYSYNGGSYTFSRISNNRGISALEHNKCSSAQVTYLGESRVHQKVPSGHASASSGYYKHLARW